MAIPQETIRHAEAAYISRLFAEHAIGDAPQVVLPRDVAVQVAQVYAMLAVAEAVRDSIVNMECNR